MIERKAYAALMRLAEQFPVVAITGPRQSGKSTLTKYAFPDKKYISFDDKNLRELAKSNPGDFLKAFPDEPYDIFFKGFYPPLHDKDKHFCLDDWFENYIDTYLDLDVKDQINADNVGAFRKFIQVCALYSGQMVNYESISRDIGVSAVTIKNWCSILEASYIIHFLEPDSNNLGRTVVKTPKLYFVDSGLMCYLLRLESKEELLLDDHKDAVVETAAVSELLKKRYNDAKKANLTYYRDKNGFEVDIITDWKKNFAIEVKSKSDVEKKLSTSVRTYVGLRTDSVQGSVFYLGDVSCEINGIRYVSWSEWGS